MGGVEFSFMSTTRSRHVAADYAGEKAASIMELRMGMIDRGANVDWLSQYPNEAEILFPPLTSLEVTGKRVEGLMIVVTVRLSVNMMSQTIEQVVSKMKQSHLQSMTARFSFCARPFGVYGFTGCCGLTPHYFGSARHDDLAPAAGPDGGGGGSTLLAARQGRG